MRNLNDFRRNYEKSKDKIFNPEKEKENSLVKKLNKLDELPDFNDGLKDLSIVDDNKNK